MTPSSFSPASLPSLLQRRPFVLFWIARVSTSMAFQIQGVAVGWQIYALTGSPFYLGLVGLRPVPADVSPDAGCGSYCRRYDRCSVARLCQVLEGLAAGALALGSFSGWQSKETILVIVFILGAARAFEGPRCRPWSGLVPAPLIPRAAAGTASGRFGARRS